jgi:PAS domain S-box-containing protein
MRTTLPIRNLDVLRGIFPDVLSSRQQLISIFLICAGYYFGALISLAFQPPNSTVSIIWIPNSILLAALLLLPARFQWILFATVFPVHYLVQSQFGMTNSLILWTYFANCSFAFISAAFLQKFIGKNFTFSEPRHVIYFLLVAVFSVPLLMAFISGGFSYWINNGINYPLFVERIFLSNAVGFGIVVPAIVINARQSPTSVKNIIRERSAETILLAGGMLVSFYLAYQLRDQVVINFPMSIFITFPALVWAALRFGQKVSAIAVLASAFASIWIFILMTGDSSAGAVANLQLGLIFASALTLILSVNAEENKNRETLLGESEHFIQQVTNTIPGILYVYDFKEQRIIYLNSQVTSVLGYGKKEIQEMGKSIIKTVVHPDDLARLPQWIARCNKLENGEIFEHEYRVRHKNGEWRWLKSRVNSFKRASGGQVQQVLAVAYDITDSKVIEEALRESELRNSSILRVLPDTMFLIHEDGTYLDYHAANENELLVSPEMFLGKNVREIMPPHIADQVFDSFKAAKETGAPQCIEYSLNMSGADNLYECRIILCGRDKFLSIVRDITELRRTEQALAESEKRFEAQYRGIPVPTYTWKKMVDDFVLVDFNDEAICERNAEVEGLLGAKASERYRDFPEVLKTFDRCFTERQTIEREEKYNLPDGEQKSFIVTYVFIPPDIVMVHTQEITARKRSLEALEYSLHELQNAQEEITAQNEELVFSRAEIEREKSRYWELFEFAPDGYLVTDQKGTILEANKAAAELLGVSQQQIKGYPITAFAGQQHKNIFPEFLASLQSGEPTQDIEISLGEDDLEFQAALKVTRVINDEGELILRWLIRNITKRKLAEKALQESERFNRSIIESSNDCIKILDLEGNLLYMNSPGQRLMEIEDDSFIGCSYPGFWSEPYAKALRTEIAKGAAGGIGRYQGPCPTARGTSKWWDVQVNPITDAEGRVERLLVISRDITEQKLAAEKLLLKEKFFRALIENTHDIISVLSLDGTIVYESPACERLLGYRAEERVGHSNFDFIHPDDLIRFKKALEEAIKNDAVYGPFEYRSRHKSGFFKTLEINGRLSTDEAGERVIIANKRDVTERKLAAEKLVKQEKFFRSLIENTHDIISVLSIQGTIVYESPACQQILGYPPEERIGHVCFDYIHPDDLDVVIEAFREALETGSLSQPVEYRYQHKNGSFVHIEAMGRIATDEAGEPIVIVNKRDITERKTMEDKLRTSEELYRNVVETQTEMICRFLPDSTLTFVNEAYCRYFGKSREELIGRKFIDLIPENARLVTTEYLKSRIATGIASWFETEVIKADGSIGWQQWINHIFKDEQGNVIELQGIGRDITEQKLAAESLRQSEERFYSFMNNSPAAAWITDEDGRVLFINPTYRKSIKLPDDEIIGKAAHEVYPEEIARQYCATIKAVAETGLPVSVIEEAVRPDNSIGTFLTYKFPLLNKEKGKRLVGGFAIDVTEQKRIEKALSESEEKYRQIVDTMLEGIWIVDAEMRITFANQQLADLLGYTIEELIGQPGYKFFADKTQNDVQLTHDKRQKGISEHYDARLRRKDGSHLWALISATPIYSLSGEFDGVLAMMSDITERKQAEEALRESEEMMRIASDAAKMYAWEIDVATGEVKFSKNVKQALGFEMPAHIEGIVSIVHPDDRNIFAGDYGTASNGKTIEPYGDYRFINPETGDTVWARGKALYFPAEKNKPARLIGITQNITESKKAEESLREQQELLHHLVQNLPNAAMNVLDRDFRFMLAEGKELEKLGLPSELLRGRLLKEAFPNGEVDYALPFLERALEGETVSFELYFSEQVYNISAAPLRDEKDHVYAVLILAQNVTEYKQKEEELQSLSARLVNLQDEERRRLGRALHDGMAQNLALMSINFSALKKMIPEDYPGALSLVEESEALVMDSLREARTLSYVLHPPLLEDRGLVSALKWYIEGFSARSNIQVDFVQHGEFGRLPAEIETALYRITQESLTNIHRHSGSQTAHIELTNEADKVILMIKDEGRGLPPNIIAGIQDDFRLLGVGIPGMRERLRLLGGQLEITSGKNGTTLMTIIPLEANEL